MPSPTFKQLEAIRTLAHDDFRPNSKQTKTTMAVSVLSNMEVPRVSRKNALLTVLALAAFVSVQHVFDPRPQDLLQPRRGSPQPDRGLGLRLRIGEARALRVRASKRARGQSDPP